MASSGGQISSLHLAIAAGGGPNARILTPEIRQRPGGNMLYVFRLP